MNKIYEKYSELIFRIVKKIYEKYLGLIFRIVLTIIVWIIWNNLSQVRTHCGYIIRSYSPLSAEQIACRTTYNEEVIFRSFFSDSYPLIIFIGIVFVALWFRKK